jgi:hypothetical protein
MSQTQNTPPLNTDKAYLIGLIVGGGEIIGQRLTITLPYRNWGDLQVNPQRGGEISQYIVRVAKPMWRSLYSMDIDYTAQNGVWQISSSVSDELKNDLKEFGLPDGGNFRQTSDIDTLSTALNNNEKIKRFIAGLTDTVGSLAPSHRHRVDSYQIISYEFTGKNFQLVADLTKLFIKIDCHPDQVLWNHPNFQGANDRYYKQWKKGFKVRIALKDYMLAGSFVSEAKQLSAQENLALASKTAGHNHTDEIRVNGRTTLHKDEYSEWLPDYIRGNHFVHYLHMGAQLGMPISSDTRGRLDELLETPEKLICPFTILTKGTVVDIEGIIKNEDYLSRTEFTQVRQPETVLSKALEDSEIATVFGKDHDKGFPISQVIHAVTFVALAEIDDEGLMGRRILGDRYVKYKSVRLRLDDIGVKILKPSRGTCLLVKSKRFAALVGYVDDEFNSTLINKGDNLSFKIAEPKYDECVVL